MAFAFVSLQGKTYSTFDLEKSPDFLTSLYNYVSDEQQSLYNTTLPFSMELISLNPKADIPYRISIISPGLYMYVELTQEEYRQKVLNRKPHMHNTYEIGYTREGEFFQQIETRRYKYTARSCCLLNRDIRHKEEYTTAFSTVILSLSPEFLKDLFSDPYNRFFSTAEFSWQDNEELRQFFNTELKGSDQQRKSYLNFFPTYDPTEIGDPIHDIFDKLAQCIIAPEPGSSFQFRSLVCKMLDQLSDKSRYSTKLINLGSKTESQIFSKITQLMEETHGRISRAELTEKLNYSGVYLNQIVNKYTGMSIFQYGAFFSMQRAAWLLTHTSMTATEISADLGFSDRTHFYKLFREHFGVTPKQYQKQNK